MVNNMMPPMSPPSITTAAQVPQTIHTLQGMINSTVPKPDRFILQAGSPFAGKTYAALSFPNPLVLDFDNKNIREGIPTIPFYDDGFVESIVRRKNPANAVNRKAALEIWLQQNVGKLKDYTVILDALTNVEVAFHQQVFGVEEKWGMNGGLYFGEKLNYFQGICALLAFDARTIATKIPPSGEIDITNKSAYEAFKACF